MKKLLQTGAAVAAIVVAAGLAQAKDKSTAEEMRDVGSFDKVELRGSMDVEVRVGGERSVKVVADSDIIDHIETEVSGSTLKIGMEHGSYRNIKRMTIYVTVPSLEGVGVYGSGDMLVEDAKADRFEIDLQGSGDANFKNAALGQLEIDLQGSGDISMNGTCDSVNVELQGSGDIDADDLKCKSATVELQGSGDVEVYASESADIDVRGSGDVVVDGSPDKVRSKVRGSGDIEIR